MADGVEVAFGNGKVITAKPKKDEKKPNVPSTGQQATRTRVIHIMQASQYFKNSVADFSKSINAILDNEPDIVGMTEIDLPNAKKAIRMACDKRGYIPVLFNRGDSGFMVRKGGDSNARVKDRMTVKITEGIPGIGLPAHLAQVCVRWYDEDIWMHEAHWAGLFKTANNNPKQHEQMTRAMCKAVKKHGEGDAFAFFGGDTNIDEGRDNRANMKNMPNYIFRESGLLTIWDEFKVVPNPTAYHSVFDIVGSYTPDKQVVGKRYKVHPKVESDHAPVSAFYEIPVGGSSAVGKPNSKPSKTKPTKGDKTGNPAKDDFYATGGNVDWTDYQDAEQYQLPQAVDDSDTYNG